MPRWLVVSVVSLGVLLLFSAASTKHVELQLNEIVSDALPHLILVAKGTLVGGILLWVLEGVFREYFSPLVAKSIQDGISQSLTALNTAVGKGFESVAGSLASEVRSFPQSWKTLSDAHVSHDLISNVKSPQVKKLLTEGNIEKAIAALDDIYTHDLSRLQDEIAVLLLSDSENAWEKAVELLDKNAELRQPKFYLTLAYRFWSVAKTSKSIDLAEAGLALTAKDDPLVPRFENSLAYYYADAQKLEKEDLARRYATDSVKRRPNEADPLDTLGFVEITFGKTREEVLAGVGLCEKARTLGGDFNLYVQHISRAELRLKQLAKA